MTSPPDAHGKRGRHREPIPPPPRLQRLPQEGLSRARTHDKNGCDDDSNLGDDDGNDGESVECHFDDYCDDIVDADDDCDVDDDDYNDGAHDAGGSSDDIKSTDDYSHLPDTRCPGLCPTLTRATHSLPLKA